MARLPRKPKLLKYPKKPRATSSTTVLDRYLDRVKLIDKTNQDRLRDYEKAVREFEAEKKRHKELVRKISGIGNAVDGIKRRRSTTRRKKAATTGRKRTRKAAVGKMSHRRKKASTTRKRR